MDNLFNEAMFLTFSFLKDDIKGQDITYFEKSDDTSGFTEHSLRAIFRLQKLLAQGDNQSVIQLKNTYIQVDGNDLDIVPKKGDYVVCKGITYDLCKSLFNNKFYDSTISTIDKPSIMSIFLLKRTVSKY